MSIKYVDINEVKRAIAGCFVVTDSNVFSLYKNALGLDRVFVLPFGEQTKCFSCLEELLEEMLLSKLTRCSTVVALGGGVIGDITGFASAVYMRGIDVIQVPTTLLAMCDSSIGGKTGINSRHAKNCFGAFHSPKEVLICTEFLQTLPQREVLCGMGEVVKTALLSAEIFSAVEGNCSVEQAVRLCSAFKQDVVSKDFLEQGLRKILNVGHTIGHALESIEQYQKSHGEYVLHGIYYEMQAFKEQVNPQYFSRVMAVLQRYITPMPIEVGEVCRVVEFDKKNREGKVSIMLSVNEGEVKEVLVPSGELGERLCKLKV